MTALRPSRPLASAGVLACLILAIVVLYLPGMEGPFIFDDNWNIQPTRIDALTFANLKDVALGNESGMLGRPIPVVTFALNWYFGSDTTSFAFKATNVTIHVFNTLLVWWFVTALCSTSGGKIGTRRRTVGWVAAAVWALHPLHVSAVLYTVQRMTLLMSTFVLLTLIAYVVARRAQSREGRLVLPWMALALPLSLGAVLSKENGALLPLYVLALEATILRHLPPSRPRYAWFRTASVTVCIATTIALVTALTLKIPSFVDAYAGRDFDMGQRVLAQLDAMTLYFQWLVLPTPSTMTFFYDGIAAPETFGPSQALGAALLTILVGGAIALRRRAPLAAFGLAFFLVAHLMESTVLPLELVFEHRNYLPSVGLALAFAVGFATLVSMRTEFVRVGTVAILAMVLMLGAMTADRAHLWSDTLSIGRHAIADQPRSERGWIEIAEAYASLGLMDDAWRTYEEALEVLPDSPHIHLQRLRTAWSHQIDKPRFFEESIRALRANPMSTPVAIALHFIVDQKVVNNEPIPTPGQLRALFDAAGPVESWPITTIAKAEMLFQHHRLLLEGREMDRARKIIDHLAELTPSNGEVLMRRAETLAMAGDATASADALEAARRFANEEDPDVRSRVLRVLEEIAELEH